MKKPKKREKNKLFHEFIGVIVFALGIFSGISVYSEATGLVGKFTSGLFFGLFGASAYAVPVIFSVIGILVIAAVSKKAHVGKIATYIVLVVSALSVIHVFSLQRVLLDKGFIEYVASSYDLGSAARTGGGAFGSLLVYPANLLLGKLGAYILFFTAILICIMVLTNLSLKKMGVGIGWAGKKTVQKLKHGMEERKLEKECEKKLYIGDVGDEEDAPAPNSYLDASPSPQTEPARPRPRPAQTGARFYAEPQPYDDHGQPDEEETRNPYLPAAQPAARRAPYEADDQVVTDDNSVEQRVYIRPPLTLLHAVHIRRPKSKGVDDIKKSAFILEDTLRSFGITATVVNVSRGPVVTRYELQPAPGVKVSRIVSLSDDIALNLAAPRVRIEAPIPGKAAIGIEVPNYETDTVFIRDILETEEFQKIKSPLAFVLGQDLAGKNVFADIATMPHLLIAGATGSGKSVCINTLISSVLFKATPQDVRMIMIDPKVVELNIYNNIPHLLVPVVTDPKKAAGALNWAVQEMATRYKTFAERGVRDLHKYNGTLAADEERLPYILVIIDELADLMIAAQNDVEDAICRIAQLGRACGIHLVIATQRPSVDVITGVIKANIPSRIAFAVSSQVDSRTIIDMAGAEKLLGKGDMLYYPIGYPKPVRLQGAFITDREVEVITNFLKDQSQSPYDEDVIEDLNGHAGGHAAGDGECDELLPKAVGIGIEYGQISISMLQRRLRIGYARAARLIDEMEVRGIVSAFEGSKPRQMLMSRDEYEDLFERDEL